MRGREFGEESVGGLGCGKGVGWRGARGIFGEGFEGILSVILSQCRELSMDSQIVRKFTLFSFNMPPAWIPGGSRSFWGQYGA